MHGEEVLGYRVIVAALAAVASRRSESSVEFLGVLDAELFNWERPAKPGHFLGGGKCHKLGVLVVDGRATGFYDSAKKLGAHFFANDCEVSGAILEEVFKFGHTGYMSVC